MADLNKVFGLIRVVVLVLVSVFAALVLIMGALVTSFTVSDLGGYFIYAAFAIAIASLTLLTVPVMIALSIARKGAFPSMIVVELSYTALLWILWLAVGGTIGNIPWINYCSSVGYYYLGYESACMETQAMAAFAFLNWIMLMVLNIFLLSLAITQANRGNSAIWTSCVTDVDYSAPAVSSGKIEQMGYGSPTTVPIAPGTPVTQYPQPIPTPQPAYPPQQVYNPQLQQPMPMSAQV